MRMLMDETDPRLTLVLLPGMDGTGELFEPFVRALGAHVKVQVIRYPKDVVLGYDELQDLVRNALPLDAPYVILGESFSGPIGIALAAESPPWMKGLVLCSTFARNPRPLLSYARALVPLMPFSSIPGMLLSQLLFGSFGTTALRKAATTAVRQVAPSVLRERLRAVMAVDVSDALRQVQVPCMCLYASDDRLVPESASLHIKSTLPQDTVVKIRAPHGMLQAAPDDAAEAVLKFVREVQVAVAY